MTTPITQPMPESSPLDRRPLKSRGWPVMQRAATALAARRVTPNSISVAGMVGGILAGLCLAATAAVGAQGWSAQWPVRVLFLVAAGLIQFRLLCNLIDGLVAVEGKMRSPLGDLYNEIPDRISDAATIIGAGYAVHSSPTLGYVAAVVALLIAYIRAIGKSTGQPSDFRGPMAKQQRMACITGACIVAAIAPGLHATLPLSADPVGPLSITLGPIAMALYAIILLGIPTFFRRLLRLARALRGAE